MSGGDDGIGRNEGTTAYGLAALNQLHGEWSLGNGSPLAADNSPDTRLGTGSVNGFRLILAEYQLY